MNPNLPQRQINFYTLEQLRNQLGEVFEQFVRIYIEQACNQPAPGRAQLQRLIEQIQQAYTALKPQLTKSR